MSGEGGGPVAPEAVPAAANAAVVLAQLAGEVAQPLLPPLSAA